jgi:intracellular sulfur oxidation DsrE/DsrF family protein
MNHDTSTRRSVLSALGGAAAALAFGARAALAQTRDAAFQPARHREDEWLNSLAGKHRSIIDCATVSGAGEGMLYANNLYVANATGYQLGVSDLAIVVCLRHFATVFAYDDAVWSKYGAAISDLVQFKDPKTKQAPTTNLLDSADYGMSLSNMGNTIASVAKRGTQFAVCDMATHFLAGEVAKAVKADPDALYKEFAANLIPNSHLVAAGVVAVNRAQEYGYTLLTAL